MQLSALQCAIRGECNNRCFVRDGLRGLAAYLDRSCAPCHTREISTNSTILTVDQDLVDRYGDCLVIQALSQGMDRLIPVVVAQLVDTLAPLGILARNDPKVRALEPAQGLGLRP